MYVIRNGNVKETLPPVSLGAYVINGTPLIQIEVYIQLQGASQIQTLFFVEQVVYFGVLLSQKNILYITNSPQLILITFILKKTIFLYSNIS